MLDPRAQARRTPERTRRLEDVEDHAVRGVADGVDRAGEARRGGALGEAAKLLGRGDADAAVGGIFDVGFEHPGRARIEGAIREDS